MRTLEASIKPEARQAIDYFVFQIRRELGAMCAVLGGLDAVAFLGRIGENLPSIRSDVCPRLDWNGLTVDAEPNRSNRPLILSRKTPIFVINTDEERVIAQSLTEFLEAP